MRLSEEVVRWFALREHLDSEILEGVYTGELWRVTVSDEPGPTGYHYWSWEFYGIRSLNGDVVGWLAQDLITSLSPRSRWKLKETFDAFGVSAATNTDDLLGRRVRLVVAYRGYPVPRSGVDAILPLEGTVGSLTAASV